jgi:hypothetical protein
MCASLHVSYQFFGSYLAFALNFGQFLRDFDFFDCFRPNPSVPLTKGIVF